MKQLFLILLFTVFSIGTYNAQAYNGNGDKKLQLGINAFGKGTGITGSFDYGLVDWFSVGGGADFYWGDNVHNGDESNFFLYGRGNFHLGNIIGLPSNMDLYPSVKVGFLNTGFWLGASLGYRYFFNDNIGAYVEVGNFGSLGVIINL